MPADKSKSNRNPSKISDVQLLKEAWRAYKQRAPIPGAGRAGFANTACRGTKSDGTPCNRRALSGGYYCKGHSK